MAFVCCHAAAAFSTMHRGRSAAAGTAAAALLHRLTCTLQGHGRARLQSWACWHPSPGLSGTPSWEVCQWCTARKC